MTTPVRLFHRMEPSVGESAAGFLMRVSHLNGLQSSAELLKYVTGSESATVQHQYIPELAYFCRNTIDEMLQLSGYEKWVNAEPRWSLQSEWITKSVFVQSRLSKVCTLCLAESPFIRALWSLSFYNHCAWHDCQLIDRCPGCKRLLQWDRRRPEYCSCRHSLSSADVISLHGNSLLLSKAIAFRLTGDASLLSTVTNKKLFEQLIGLSVDGMCKSIWFLGHCLPDLGQHSTGHGRKKPALEAFELMLDKAFFNLGNWPDAVGQQLEKLVFEQLQPEFSAVAFHYLLRPLDHYLKTSLDSAELAFIGHVYEQHLQKIWRRFGKKNTGSRYEKQLILDF